MNSISLKANRKYPSLPGVGNTADSHVNLLNQIREAIATHERRSGDVMSSFLRLQELIDLGLATRQGDKLILNDFATGGGGGATTLADLTDVDLTGLADGDALVYDSGSGLWVPAAVAADSLANVDPDTHPSSPNDADDEFEFGSGLDTTGARRAGAISWVKTAYGSSASTETISRGSLVSLTTGGDNPVVIRQTIASPTTAWKYRAKITMNRPAGFVNFNQVGMHAYRSANTKWSAVHKLYSSGRNVETAKWTANTFDSASAYGDIYGGDVPYRDWLYFEIEFDNTNLYFRWSATGHDGSFVTLLTEAKSTWLSGDPDQIGLHNHQANASAGLIMFVDWFRRVA